MRAAGLAEAPLPSSSARSACPASRQGAGGDRRLDRRAIADRQRALIGNRPKAARFRCIIVLTGGAPGYDLLFAGRFRRSTWFYLAPARGYLRLDMAPLWTSDDRRRARHLLVGQDGRPANRSVIERVRRTASTSIARSTAASSVCPLVIALESSSSAGASVLRPRPPAPRWLSPSCRSGLFGPANDGASK